MFVLLTAMWSVHEDLLTCLLTPAIHVYISAVCLNIDILLRGMHVNGIEPRKNLSFKKVRFTHDGAYVNVGLTRGWLFFDRIPQRSAITQ